MSLKGKRALVTGGTRGIGAAIASHLSKQGAEVWITGRNIDSEQGQQGYFVDFLSTESTRLFLANLNQDTVFDILVNNAGINHIDKIQDYPTSDLEALMRVNCEMVMKITQMVAAKMIESEVQGKIVNIASIWATQTKIGRSIYSATKSALTGFTRGSAVDLAEHGILVNAVSPGFTETELTRRTMGDAGIAEMSALIPMQRLAQPEEIAKAIGFLVGNDNTYITGQNIIIDGGFTII